MNQDNDVYYSQASLWEISIKYNLGKIVLKDLHPEDLYSEIKSSFLKCKNFNNDELVTFYKLPIEHRDPFDRLMIWQCIQSDLFFASADGEIEKYQQYGLKILS
jgi:PIN domain nuclease of toxin-antitoxin system